MCNCKENKNLTIKILKIDPNLPDLEKIKIGNWIDLRVSFIIDVENKKQINWLYDDVNKINYVYLEKNIHYLMKLGFACKLPDGYEGRILPRSSTFKNWGILLTNSMGIIDNSYSGNSDEYITSFFSTKEVKIVQYERIVQFRIEKIMPEINIEYVTFLDDKNRNGFGSTGKN